MEMLKLAQFMLKKPESTHQNPRNEAIYLT
jgi:hypothetical protein